MLLNDSRDKETNNKSWVLQTQTINHATDKVYLNHIIRYIAKPTLYCFGV